MQITHSPLLHSWLIDAPGITYTVVISLRNLAEFEGFVLSALSDPTSDLFPLAEGVSQVPLV